MDAPPRVAAANAAARAMLRDHLRDYVERNGDDASYGAWIATVHPENVGSDDRLRLPQSSTSAMWDARPRVANANRQAGSGGGLVALLVGAVFAFAVFAAALAFIAARAPLFFGTRALSRLRGALSAYSISDDDQTWSASLRACSPAWPPSFSCRLRWRCSSPTLASRSARRQRSRS